MTIEDLDLLEGADPLSCDPPELVTKGLGVFGSTESLGVTGRLLGPDNVDSKDLVDAIWGTRAVCILLFNSALDCSSICIENLGNGSLPCNVLLLFRRCSKGDMSSLSVWLDSGVENECCNDCGPTVEFSWREMFGVM